MMVATSVHRRVSTLQSSLGWARLTGAAQAQATATAALNAFRGGENSVERSTIALFPS
jgi:hypothetical protein